MDYDGEEWQRPWTTGDADARSPFAPAAAGAAAGSASATAADTSTVPIDSPSPWREPGMDDSGAARQGQAAAAAVDRQDDHDLDQNLEHQGLGQDRGDDLGQDGGDHLGDQGALAEDGGVQATLPLAPPATWNEDDTGPGSPHGSVRPPDTTGTFDADGAPSARRGRRGIAAALLGGIVGSVIGTAATLALVSGDDSFRDGPRVQAPVVQADGSVTGQTSGGIVTAVAQAVTPSVVRIDVLANDVPGATGDVPTEFGLGSGVIYRSDGYILTNNHVVVDADVLRVRLANGDRLDAELVGTDPLNDLAVLKVDRTGLPAVNVRQDPKIRVGETAIAIGSPFGLDASVTAGVVSALNREISVPDESGQGGLVIPSVLQTDAAINPGNSGGALVDAEGRLIGINTAILSGTGGSQGVGFAIPVESAVSIGDELIENGFVRHAFLGITGVDLTPEVIEQFDLQVDSGAVVDSVQADSGAADAGLEANDIIVAVDGTPIESMSELVGVIRKLKPGDTITMDVVRSGESLSIDVTLGERPRDLS